MVGNKRGIPEIRERLLEIADETGIDELRDLVDEMYRNPSIRRAPRRSDSLTPQKAAEIRRYAKAHPTLHQRDIGNHFNMNPGRVSEALNRRK